MKTILAGFALTMFTTTAGALPENRAAALTGQLQSIVDDSAIPLTGLSAVAIRHGKIVYTANLGFRRLQPKQPVDANTMFRVASVSKFVAALGAMKLVEQGRLKLDADIGDYLGYRLRNPHFPDKPITLRMLLTHTSSLRDDGGFKWAPSVNLKDVLQAGGRQYQAKAWATNAAPGDYFEYVNFNWGLIATVMERAGAERFDRLMRRLIFDPMGLKAGFYLADFAPADIADVATLYRRREKDGDEKWDPKGPWIAQSDDFSAAPPTEPEGLAGYAVGTNGTLFGPQGSLRISAAELAKIMLMLMHEGRCDGRQILAPETVRLLFSRQWTLNGDGKTGNGDSDYFHGLYHAWGLGNQHFTDTSFIRDGRAGGDRLVEGGGFTGVGHLGWSWGLNALFVFDPKTNDGLIYISSGVGDDPERHPGRFSSESRFQERITDALVRGAIRGETQDAAAQKQGSASGKRGGRQRPER